MTANNAPSPYVAAASTINSATRDAYRAFDRGITDASGWLSANNNSTGWISMDFGSGNSIIIDGYTIFGSGTQNQNPRNWTFEGSNDNVSWTVLQTVTLPSAIAASSTYSVASIGNSTAYRYYRVNITLNGGSTNVAFNELELYQPGTISLASGGSFNFNTAGVTVSATSTSSALSAGATNLITVTATTGTVTLSLGSSVTATIAGNLINHTGNCNFNLNGLNFTSGVFGDRICLNKTSTGTITIVGNVFGNGAVGINSTNGNTIITGNVAGSSAASFGISQTAGNVTVTGNVTGGTGANAYGISLTGAASQFTIIGNVTGGTGTSAFGINFTGTSGSVTGTVTGGVGGAAYGINTSGVINVTGNVIGGNGGAGIFPSSNITVIGNITGGSANSGIGTNSAISINITGTVTATSTGLGIGSTSTGTVLLTGNMLNVAGRQAIFAQNLFISDTTTTQWRLFTPGGQDKTLYSADTFPNQPSSANVRSGSLFGPSNVLSGSMVVPVPSDVRVNVLTDNTVGTGQSLTAADFLAAISASADPYAQRLRNVATVDTVGSLLTGFNNGGF
jgi:hypothetical protein